MNVSDFNFDLPQELIAQDPLEDRSSSRLLVLDKKTGEIEHRVFRDILSYLRKGDCLVINDTKVIPARLFGVKEDTQAKIEVLLLKRKENDIWETLVKPGKKAKPGTVISFGDGRLKGTVIDVVEEGNRLIQFSYEGIFEEILDQLGQMPLPPYITHQLQDKNRYQTVYAKHEGSAAAPTAGLHFTQELLKQIEEMGVTIAHVTLHVGLGTFRPVKVENILDHHMHSEFYMVEEEEAEKINRTKQNGGRVICVGTTSCRTIESAAGEDGILKAGSGWTEIFIYPGYRFKILDALITNFHLPESTLVMLVSALAGREHVLNAYQEAIKERYRFFSFGDAMFIADGIHDRNAEKASIEKTGMEEIRLNKYLSEMGICSRREADRLIEEGRVTVDGRTASTGMKINPGQKVICDGRQVGISQDGKRRKPRPVLLMVNKPRGVVSTTSEKDRAMNIVELVKYPERVYPVGRLDKDSEGLILMTNQGDLVNKMMRSGNAHEKEYIVTIDKPVTAEFLEKMQDGVWLEELKVTTKPCTAKATGKREFQIILTQGLNRQIRRMCEALGCHVLTLKRVRIMNLKLGNLKTGTYRRVTAEEYRELLELLEESINLPYAESVKNGSVLP